MYVVLAASAFLLFFAYLFGVLVFYLCYVGMGLVIYFRFATNFSFFFLSLVGFLFVLIDLFSYLSHVCFHFSRISRILSWARKWISLLRLFVATHLLRFVFLATMSMPVVAFVGVCCVFSRFPVPLYGWCLRKCLLGVLCFFVFVPLKTFCSSLGFLEYRVTSAIPAHAVFRKDVYFIF